MFGNRKRGLPDPVGCSITEGDARFLSCTRLFTKRRKDWPGKKKPQLRKELEDKEKEENESYFNLKKSKIKTTCIYCGQDYKGSYKEDHEDECEPKPQQFKEFCSRCNSHNIPSGHICGVKDFYYTIKKIEIKNDDGIIIEKYIVDHEESHYK